MRGWTVTIALAIRLIMARLVPAIRALLSDCQKQDVDAGDIGEPTGPREVARPDDRLPRRRSLSGYARA